MKCQLGTYVKYSTTKKQLSGYRSAVQKFTSGSMYNGLYLIVIQ